MFKKANYTQTYFFPINVLGTNQAAFQSSNFLLSSNPPFSFHFTVAMEVASSPSSLHSASSASYQKPLSLDNSHSIQLSLFSPCNSGNIPLPNTVNSSQLTSNYSTVMQPCIQKLSQSFSLSSICSKEFPQMFSPRPLCSCQLFYQKFHSLSSPLRCLPYEILALNILILSPQ